MLLVPSIFSITSCGNKAPEPYTIEFIKEETVHDKPIYGTNLRWDSNSADKVSFDYDYYKEFSGTPFFVEYPKDIGFDAVFSINQFLKTDSELESLSLDLYQTGLYTYSKMVEIEKKTLKGEWKGQQNGILEFFCVVDTIKKTLKIVETDIYLNVYIPINNFYLLALPIDE